MQKLPCHRILFLLVLGLFLVEYLNPSAIGVRADYTPVQGGSATQKKQASPDKEAPSTTPHSMVKIEPYRPGEILPSVRLITLFQSLTEQIIQKEIFHPPASAL